MLRKLVSPQTILLWIFTLSWPWVDWMGFHQLQSLFFCFHLFSLTQLLAFTFLYFCGWKIDLSFSFFGHWLPEGRGHGRDGRQCFWEKYKELFLAWIWHVPKVRLLSQEEVPESGVGERLQTLLGCLWLQNFGKDLPHHWPWASPDRDHMWSFCVYPTATLTSLRVGTGWHLDPEGIDQLCSHPWPSGVSIWLLSLSWSQWFS